MAHAIGRKVSPRPCGICSYSELKRPAELGNVHVWVWVEQQKYRRGIQEPATLLGGAVRGLLQGLGPCPASLKPSTIALNLRHWQSQALAIPGTGNPRHWQSPGFGNLRDCQSQGSVPLPVLPLAILPSPSAIWAAMHPGLARPQFPPAPGGGVRRRLQGHFRHGLPNFEAYGRVRNHLCHCDARANFEKGRASVPIGDYRHFRHDQVHGPHRCQWQCAGRGRCLSRWRWRSFPSPFPLVGAHGKATQAADHEAIAHA